jgi:phosphate transport system protein
MERSLKEHTVKSFDGHLENISNLISAMSDLTITSVNIVNEAIEGKSNLVEKINKHDEKINKADNNIENEIVAFIALRQPKAYDLRFSVSAIKVSANLERVGDYAKNVVKKISKFDTTSAHSKDLNNMTKIAKDMIKDSIDALIHNDLEKSQRVLAKDDEIDAIYHEIFSKFKSQTLSEDSRELIDTLFIAKSIERLADHAVNIAAIVNYTVTGKII